MKTTERLADRTSNLAAWRNLQPGPDGKSLHITGKMKVDHQSDRVRLAPRPDDQGHPGVWQADVVIESDEIRLPAQAEVEFSHVERPYQGDHATIRLVFSDGSDRTIDKIEDVH